MTNSSTEKERALNTLRSRRSRRGAAHDWENSNQSSTTSSSGWSLTVSANDATKARLGAQLPEVELMLRLQNGIDSNKQLQAVKQAAARFMALLEKLSVAATASISKADVFQAILLRAHGSQVSFDSQSAFGDVPMHQAKVISYNHSNEVHRALDSMSASAVGELVAEANEMRQLLRLKIDDHSDLSAAENAAETLHVFLCDLEHAAEARGLPEFQLLQSLR